MSTHATAQFSIRGWEEKPINEGEGLPKMTRAAVHVGYTGDIEGEGASECLMVYTGEDASFVSVERVTGKLDGKSGTFVLQGSGTYDKAACKAICKWFVVPGSATGELAGLRGDGGYVAVQSPSNPATLDYSFE